MAAHQLYNIIGGGHFLSIDGNYDVSSLESRVGGRHAGFYTIEHSALVGSQAILAGDGGRDGDKGEPNVGSSYISLRDQVFNDRSGGVGANGCRRGSRPPTCNISWRGCPASLVNNRYM